MASKITISEIENIYKQYQLDNAEFHLWDNRFFKHYIRKSLDQILKDLDVKGSIFDFDPMDYKGLSNEEKAKKGQEFEKLKKTFKSSIEKNITKPDEVDTLNLIFLTESISCLDNAIYWFLNYKLNCSRFTRKAGMQSLYYSEFFALNSIAEFLGIAINYQEELNEPYKICRFRQKTNPHLQIRIEPFNSSGHAGRFNVVKDFFNQKIDLSDSIDLNEWFNNGNVKSLLKSQRETYVYDISDKSNYPWNFSYYPNNEKYIMEEERKNYCFLNGDELYSNQDISDDDPSGFYDYITLIYSNWGYEEHHIGTLIKWMIQRLHNINAKSYINRTKDILENFMPDNRPDEIKAPIEIIISWLEGKF